MLGIEGEKKKERETRRDMHCELFTWVNLFEINMPHTSEAQQ